MIISTDSRQSYFHSIGFPKFCLQTKNSRIYLLMQNCSMVYPKETEVDVFERI